MAVTGVASAETIQARQRLSPTPSVAAVQIGDQRWDKLDGGDREQHHQPPLWGSDALALAGPGASGDDIGCKTTERYAKAHYLECVRLVERVGELAFAGGPQSDRAGWRAETGDL
jgi:hypothetical protein